MTRKLVAYNGRKEMYYPCDDPSVLTKGKWYEVIDENVSSWHTEYRLKGINGRFNSVWFDEVKTYLALSYEIPQKGEPMRRFMRWENNAWRNMARSSCVLQVTPVTSGVYCVQTNNSLYVVQHVAQPTK